MLGQLGNEVAKPRAELKDSINYLDAGTCKAMCQNCEESMYLRNLHERLLPSVLSSLEALGTVKEVHEADVLLSFSIYGSAELRDAKTPASVSFVIVSAGLARHGRVTQDQFVFTMLDPFPNIAFDMDAFKANGPAGLVLRHNRVPFVKPDDEPKAPFNCAQVGSLNDLDLDELLSRILRCHVASPSPFVPGRPEVVTVERILHSTKLHSELPLDTYVCDALCEKFLVISEALVTVGEGAPACPAGPAPVADVEPAPRFLQRASSAQRQRPGPNGRGPSIRGNDNGSMHNAFQQLVSQNLADVDKGMQEDLMQAMKFMSEEAEGSPSGGHGSGDEVASAATQSDAGDGGSESDEINILPEPPLEKRPRKSRAGDVSTYGTMGWRVGTLGSIVWSYGRKQVMACCNHPDHNLPGQNRCRMGRVAEKRPQGALGCFLLCQNEASSKSEHMRLAKQKMWSEEQRLIGRSLVDKHVPPETRRDPRYERPRRRDEPLEPVNHP